MILCNSAPIVPVWILLPSGKETAGRCESAETWEWLIVARSGGGFMAINGGIVCWVAGDGLDGWFGVGLWLWLAGGAVGRTLNMGRCCSSCCSDMMVISLLATVAVSVRL